MAGESTPPVDGSPEKEHENHNYRSSEIPWYVHLLWVSFWIFAVCYLVIYVLPQMQSELLSPP
jgi:hypothetical protein